MATVHQLSEEDKKLWKKIKRNGHFSKQKKFLLRSIDSSSVNVSKSEGNNVNHKLTPEKETPYVEYVSGESFADIPDDGETTTDENMDDEAHSDDEYGYSKSETDHFGLLDDLRSWAIDHQIKHLAINSLLMILKNHIEDNVLPADARTLLKTPRKTAISAEESLGGKYWHYGLTRILTEAVMNMEYIPDKLSLNVNIDGLPAYKSSTTSFWPILVNIEELKKHVPPLIVGIFCGLYKPKDTNAFLKPFVTELNNVLLNGLKIREKSITVMLRCFICDTPARSMLRGVIGHNGYSSCLKCTTEGEYSTDARTMIFPQMDAPLRTDNDFRARIYDGHHKTDSILETIHGLDMIQDFPIGDALHLIDLGITKRFLSGWKNGNLNNYNAKWSAKETNSVSAYLQTCKLPREIVRKVRSLDHLSHWKGSEFRTFLLYLSPVVLKKFFTDPDISAHFLTYFCAIQICSRAQQCEENLNVAKSLITDFLNGTKILYGQQLFTSNMHNLTHLIDDVKRFGPLGTFDAYPFESKLYYLKRLIRSGNLPLSQVSRRIIEIQSNISCLRQKKPNNVSKPVLKKQYAMIDHSDQKLQSVLAGKKCHFYKYVKCDSFCIDSESLVDKWILSEGSDVVSVKYIIHDIEEDLIYLYGYPIQNLIDFFIRPVASSTLHIYGSNVELKPCELFHFNKILCKMVKIDCDDNDLPNSVFFPLIHTLV